MFDRLVWSDEFDYEGLPDPERWCCETGYVRNHEEQYYTFARRENARVQGGRLVIEARRESFPNPDWHPAAVADAWRRHRKTVCFTSASLSTSHSGSWLGGRFEVRAKVPEGRGTWPAIWMLPTEPAERWPAGGEIDIMEHVGHDPDRFHANIHTAAYNHVTKTGKGGPIAVPDASGAFHTFSLLWLPDRLEFACDGEAYFTYAKESNDPAVWPFTRPFHLKLNLAVGGIWGGQEGIDEAAFPHRYEVDWVRVYQ